jgi:mono/diheme cytochrome c family protein
MKKFLKITALALAALVLALTALLSYVKLALPDVGPAPDITVDKSPEAVAHGKYLALNVALCVDCHSNRDWSYFGGKFPDDIFNGGNLDEFTREAGLPGNFYAPNLTPTHLGNWTDGEIYRAITMGVSKDGRPLFGLMPFHNYGKLDDRDIHDIIAFLRSVPPSNRVVPASEADFPVSFIMHTVPAKNTPQARPDTTDLVAYGKYLFTMASCSDCHTPMDKGAPIMEKFMAGGQAFKLPQGTVHAANITPDPETGIGNMSKEAFLSRFHAYSDSTWKPYQVEKGGLNTTMPWKAYSGMSDTDLGAIYAYLRTLPPIHNKVEKFISRY